MKELIICERSDLITVADSIRTYTGETSGMTLGDMVDALNGVFVTIPKGRMKGDVDGNGVVTENDYMLIMQALAGSSPELDTIQTWCGDINGDGKADSDDAVAIMGNSFTMSDYYGNWAYVKVDDLSGYFYCDVSSPNVTASSTATLLVDSYADCFLEVECMNGVARVKAERLPLEDVKGCIMVNMFTTPDVTAEVETQKNLISQIMTILQENVNNSAGGSGGGSSSSGGTSVKTDLQSNNNDLQTILGMVGSLFKMKFTIDGTTYQAEQGMTWKEWCNSDDNIDEYYVRYTIVWWDANTVVTLNSNPCLEGDVIVNGGVYITTSVSAS